MPESFIPVWMSIGEAEEFRRFLGNEALTEAGELPEREFELIDNALTEEKPRSYEQMRAERGEPSRSREEATREIVGAAGITPPAPAASAADLARAVLMECDGIAAAWSQADPKNPAATMASVIECIKNSEARLTAAAHAALATPPDSGREEGERPDHELKCWPPYFEHVLSGRKTFEARSIADRRFEVGDTLLLREYDNRVEGGYTGRSCRRRVSYVLGDGDYGIEPGHVVLALQPATTSPPDRGDGDRLERWTGVANIAWCPEHGLHGARDTCFECGKPVEQIPMLEVGAIETAQGALRALIKGPSRPPVSVEAAESLIDQARELAEEALTALQPHSKPDQGEGAS